MDENNALIIVDFQRDFTEGGAIPLENTTPIAETINRIASKFKRVIATQEWHPPDHISFAKMHPGMKPFESIMERGKEVVLWPDHCIQDSPGAEFHPELVTSNFDLVLKKGCLKDVDCTSIFFEGEGKSITIFEPFINTLGITDLYFCGLSGDYCIFDTAMDALQKGYRPYVIVDAVRCFDLPSGRAELAMEAMREEGVRMVLSTEL